MKYFSDIPTPAHAIPKLRYWGDRGGHLKMDLLRKLYLLTAENVKRAREGWDPAETTTQKNDFKVNDLVLVRAVTSGAFAPRYTPDYQIVVIHGPNRIVVRDENGNETVRRASHLKVCDLKTVVASMVPEQSEYSSFGRSTKLLLHPKDVPDLQFTSKAEEKGKISPITDILEIDLAITDGRADSSEITTNRGKNSPDSHDNSVIKSNKQFNTGYTQELRKEGKILPGTATDSQPYDLNTASSTAP